MPELWPFTAHGTATEVLDWRTDVLQSQSREQRISLRSVPREILTLRHRLDGSGIAAAADLARRGMADDWIVPLWMMAEPSNVALSAAETIVPVSAAQADYRAPGFVVLATAGGGAHLLEVAGVRADGIDLLTPLGVDLAHPIVAPARRARLLTPLEIERRHAGLGIVTARFLLQDSADLSGLRGVALYIAIDASTSMSGAKIAAAMAAVKALVEELGTTVPPVLRNDICVVFWNATVTGVRLYRDADRSDLASLADWLTAPVALGGATDFEVALSQAPDFFSGAGAKRRIVLFLTDGEPHPAGSVDAAVTLRDTIDHLEVFGFNIGLTNTAYTARLDNTGVDGVPIIASGDTDALRDTLLGTLLGLVRYSGQDVLIDPSLVRQPLPETVAQAFEAVDSGLGPIVLEPLRDLVERGSVLSLYDTGLAECWSRRRWLHSLRGRQRAFWLPTWGRELVLQAPVTSSDTSVFVAALADPGAWTGRHVMFDIASGPVVRQITNVVFDALGLKLTIAAPGKNIPVTTPIHLLTKVRLDTDRIELEHFGNRSEFAASVIEIPE